jgi:PAS domain S-box-containing protein
MKRLTAELRKPYFWLILVVFAGIVFLHYSQYFPSVSFNFNSLIGLERHSVERILLLAVIILSGILSGLTVGIAYLILSAGVMLFFIFLPGNFTADAVFEVCLVIILGLGLNVWFETHRRDVGKREQALLKLEAVQREVQAHINTVRANEKRLEVLHSVATAINQFSRLDDILNKALDMIMEAVEVDGVMVYLINDVKNELQLHQYRGISEEFARGIDHLAIGEGFNGWVAKTGQPSTIENSTSDTRLSREAVKKEVIGSQYIVPLMAREKVVGTLCMLSHAVRSFSKEEQQLLILIGAELGVAVERTALSEEKERTGRKFKELFDKAHDSIWMQDLDGRILDANQAMADFTGYSFERLIGGAVFRALKPEALILAREVRRKLLSGEKVDQPYEQKIIKSDGTEATIMLTTSLIKEEGKPPVFQHISRDVTHEKKLAENLRLYAQQITQTQEEERKRIARELHDDSIQSLIVLGRRVEELIAALPEGGEENRLLEEVRSEIDNIIKQIRRFIQDLRPPTLDYLGLIPTVRELILQLEHQSSIKSEFKVIGGEKHFIPEDEMLIYRIIQEAVNNVYRHSGAKNVQIAIEFRKGDTLIRIKDDGKGFVIGEDMRFLQAGKIGLAGMQERADLLGSSLSVQSSIGHGTTVTLTIPDERCKK